MLDISTAIDDSFANMSNAPKFVPGVMAPRDDREASEKQFMRDMEARFQAHLTNIAIWQKAGREHRADMEAQLSEGDVVLDTHHLIRIQLLVDDMTERVEQDIDFNSKRLKHMKKMGRKLRGVSPRCGDFITKLSDRLRVVAEAEMEELILAIDWWRGVMSTYDPHNERSKAFDNPADVLAILKSA